MELSFEEYKQCQKAHGYVSSSSDSEDCKSELDEEYEDFKPPPILINPTRHTIIKITHSNDDWFFNEPGKLSFADAVKKKVSKAPQIEKKTVEAVKQKEPDVPKTKKRRSRKRRNKVEDAAQSKETSVNAMKQKTSRETNEKNERKAGLNENTGAKAKYPNKNKILLKEKSKGNTVIKTTEEPKETLEPPEKHGLSKSQRRNKRRRLKKSLEPLNMQDNQADIPEIVTTRRLKHKFLDPLVDLLEDNRASRQVSYEEFFHFMLWAPLDLVNNCMPIGFPRSGVPARSSDQTLEPTVVIEDFYEVESEFIEPEFTEASMVNIDAVSLPARSSDLTLLSTVIEDLTRERNLYDGYPQNSYQKFCKSYLNESLLQNLQYPISEGLRDCQKYFYYDDAENLESWEVFQIQYLEGSLSNLVPHHETKTEDSFSKIKDLSGTDATLKFLKSLDFSDFIKLILLYIVVRKVLVSIVYLIVFYLDEAFLICLLLYFSVVFIVKS